MVGQIDNCDSLVNDNETAMLGHRHCLSQYIERVNADIEEQQEKASYIRGILGGLLGGILAIIPTLLTIIFLDLMFVYLYFLIPIGIYCGYTKLDGKLYGPLSAISTSVYALFLMPIIDSF